MSVFFYECILTGYFIAHWGFIYHHVELKDVRYPLSAIPINDIYFKVTNKFYLPCPCVEMYLHMSVEFSGVY